MFYKKLFLIILSKSEEITFVPIPFLNKVTGSKARACNLSKKRLQAQMFPNTFQESLQDTFFMESLRTTALVNLKLELFQVLSQNKQKINSR